MADSFSHIIGQDRAISFLKKVITGNKIPHAYLFTGISGVGKTSTAIAMSQALNCNETIEGAGCGQCKTCRQIKNGTFTDLVIIEPDGYFIKIEQVRELNHALYFKPASGRYRISIINNAEKMTEEAANSFLKTLEEPPQGNVLILKVVEPLDLLPTIVSRCQKIPFRPLPESLIDKQLRARFDISDKDSRLLSKLSDGSLGAAIEMFEVGMLEYRQGIISEVIDLLEIPSVRILDMAQGYSKKSGKTESRNTGQGNGELFKLFIIWKTWFRDLILLKGKGPAENLINFDYSLKMESIALKYKMDNLVESFFIVDSAQRELRRNPNLGLLMENTLLTLKRLAN